MQAAVTRSLARSAHEPDRFMELERVRVKREALDCACNVLEATVGGLSRIIPHHSKETRWLKALLTHTEIHARKEQGSNSAPQSRVLTANEEGMGLRTVGTAGELSVLSALWTPQNQARTEDWLRMLRHRQSGTVTKEWHCLRWRELTEAAERERMGAINK